MTSRSLRLPWKPVERAFRYSGAPAQRAPGILSKELSRRLLFVALLAVIAILAWFELSVGTRSIPASDLIAVFRAYDPDNPNHLVLWSMRMPRLCAALLVGAALAVSGTLMQDTTRNPLADPGLLGVNAGAAFAVVLSIWILGVSDPGQYIWPALAGAGLSAVFVYWLAALGTGSPTPIRHLLAGAALTALLFALIRALLLVSQETLDVYRFWVVGSLKGISFADITPLLPFFGAGFAAAAISTRFLNALALGSDSAASLGVRPGMVRLLTTATVTCLCAAAVGLAGPIGFVGLVVPHMARALVGVNARHVVLFSSLIGAALLLAADIVGRLVFSHADLQAGVMVALLGAPAFVWLIRRTRIMRS